jgi:hypothetical protein
MHPAGLCVVSDGQHDSSGIFLRSRGKLEAVCSLSSPSPDSVEYPPTVLVDTATQFTGYIMSNSLADIRGTVFGSIVTQQFNYSLPPTTYVNWVRNAIIDRTKMIFSMPIPILVSQKHEPLSVLSYSDAH